MKFCKSDLRNTAVGSVKCKHALICPYGILITEKVHLYMYTLIKTSLALHFCICGFLASNHDIYFASPIHVDGLQYQLSGHTHGSGNS